ncbi:MAG: hypothetical protein V1775_19135 [Bacteroidota bacterium]
MPPHERSGVKLPISGICTITFRFITFRIQAGHIAHTGLILWEKVIRQNDRYTQTNLTISSPVQPGLKQVVLSPTSRMHLFLINSIG